MVDHKKSRKSDAPPPGLATRRAALHLLLAVRRDGRLLAELTDDEEGPLAGLPAPERARANRLATEALRHGQRIDKALAPYLQKAPPPRVRMMLHLATIELCQDRSAPHGVVHSWVSLTRGHPKTRSMAGLMNAVLRRVSEHLPQRWDSLPPSRLPDWLRKPFRAAYGGEAVAAMERVFSSDPPLDLTAKNSDPAALALRLGGVALPTGSVRLAAPGQVSALDGYEPGDWWVQDAAAAIPVRALGDVTGLEVLDLCAAPGGKTLQLAAQGAKVTAVDISNTRLARLRENLARCRLEAEVVVADASTWEPERSFDAILLDAPCSATGTIRRHPDLPFAKTTDGQAPLIDLQARLLDRATAWLRPGGSLVFCTCSLLPEEGERQIAKYLTHHPEMVDATPLAATLGLPSVADPATPGLRLRPDFFAELGGMDGFFIARLRRHISATE